jgi:hypothetical protein
VDNKKNCDDYQAGKDKVQGNSDSIRIVPLYLPEEIFIAGQIIQGVPPNLTYQGGVLLSNVQIFSIFWGSAWGTMPQSDLKSKLDNFFGYIVSSNLIDELKEYSVPQYQIGLTTPTLTLNSWYSNDNLYGNENINGAYF